MVNKNLIRNISLKNLIFLLFIISLFSTIALAIPDSLTLQGKLTNTAGASQQGTFNFTFRIYDASTDGNILWELANYNITTDANGIYDVILGGINLSFADQYYLGITVSTDGESGPRVNLTSAPYSFRANTSEALNPNASYFVTNLSIGGHATIGNGTTTLEVSTQSFNLTTAGYISTANNITLGEQIKFKFGQIIDNLVNGWLKLTGSLNVTSNLSAGNALFVDSVTGNVGIGIASPAQKLEVGGSLKASGFVNFTNNSVFNQTLYLVNGSVGISTSSPVDTLTVIGSVSTFGSLNATSINATTIRMGTTMVQLSTDFNLGNISNYTQYIRGSDFSLGNVSNYTYTLRNGSVANFSDVIVKGNLNISGWINVRGNVSFSQLTNCNTIDTDANGLFTCGVDTGAGGEFSSFQLGNVSNFTEYMRHKDFNLGNVSNYTQYIKAVDFSVAGNISNYTQYMRSSDFSLGNVSNYTQYIKGADFSVGGNISNYTQYIKSADFNLGNISNNTIKSGENVSIALWNITFGNATYYHTRDSSAFVLIGNPNFTTRNLSDALTVVGSAAVFGSLNATSINATTIRMGTGMVQLSGDFDLRNISNYTQYMRSSDFNLGNISNYTQYIKAVDFSVGGNISNYTQYTKSADFNLGNISNNTLLRGDNASIGLWNISISNIFPRIATVNVGIGTSVPDNRLTIAGSDADANLAAIGLLHLNITDSYNTSTINLITLDHNLNNPENSTGGIGIGILFRAVDNYSQMTNVSFINASLVNAKNGSEASALSFYTMNGTQALIPKLVLNGSDVFIAPTGGKVGIGTTSPVDLLDVNSSKGGITINANNGFELTFSGADAANIRHASANQNILILPASGGQLHLGSNGVNSQVVLQSGNVGIGDTTPGDALEVVGNVRVSGSLNASFINATTIRMGTTMVQLSTDFTLGNISNYTQYIRGSDFNLGNVSNYTQYLKNNSDVKITSLNITGGVGTYNLTIGNGTMFYNGSGICIMSC